MHQRFSVPVFIQPCVIENGIALAICYAMKEEFANLKKSRIKGLIAHAKYPISTGKLEGFNNKIKVAKRIGYGYRNEDNFFKLIR